MSEKNSSNRPNSSRNNNRNRNRHNNRNRRPQNRKQNDGEGQQTAHNKGPNNKNRNQTRSAGPKPGGQKPGGQKPRSNHHNRNNRNRRPKTLTPSRILIKYDNLLEQYLIARRKFCDQFGRANQKQFEKIKKNYQLALKNLRDFEMNLEDWQKEVLSKRVNLYPEDNQYTQDHNIPKEGDIVNFTGDFEDPHLLPTQKAEKWSEDTEESEGTFEDYLKYKGLSAS